MKKHKSTTITPAAPAADTLPNFRKYYYILGILVFFLFANSISNGYNLDDELVTRNHKLTSRGLEAVGDIFKSSYYSDDMGYAYGYRPIVHLSFALEHQFFGEKPGVSHFFNVVLYVLSTLLFFKLLLKWTGEKGVALALLATVLFAVHPLHSEVVASIKNRDEILAFLFAILAGLSIEKFLDQKWWTSLFSICLFFTLAMLSKKSVFPMAVLFPIIAVFVRKAELKPLVQISIALIIPAVLIGSEMNWNRMALMLAAVSIPIALCYWMKSQKNDWKKTLTDYRLIAAISFCILAFALFRHNTLYLFPALLLLMVAYQSNKRAITIVFLCEMLVASWFFRDFEMTFFGLFVSLYLVFGNLLEKRKDWLHLGFVLCFAAVLLLRTNVAVNNLYGIFASVFFLYFFHRKWMVAVAASVLIAVTVLVLGENFTLFSILLLLLSVLKVGEVYVRKFDPTPWLLVGGLIILFAFQFGYGKLPFAQKQGMHTAEMPLDGHHLKKTAESKNFLKEGRNLEFIENTLVAPHTPAETFATGAATLGEYAKLLVFPYELSFYYGYAKTKTVNLQNPWVWTSILFHLLLIALAGWQLKKRPLLSLGIAWYLACILLFSNWIELVAGMVGERLAFTASAGFCLFIAALLFWIKPRFSIRKPGLLEFATLAVVLVFAGRTIVRNADWKSSLTLMGHDIQHLENSAQANNLYAMNLMQSSFSATDDTFEANQEKQRLAVNHFDKAVKIWPGFFNAAYDKGRAAMSLQDTTAAIDGFEKAVAIGNENFLDPYYHLGNLYLAKKRNKDFLLLSKKTFETNNSHPDAYSFLAKGHSINGHNDSARLYLQKGLAKFPRNADLLKNLEALDK